MNLKRELCLVVLFMCSVIPLQNVFAEDTVNSIFGNLNIQEAQQAEQNFEASKKLEAQNAGLQSGQLIDTHEEQKTVVKFETRENKLWRKDNASTTDASVSSIDRGDSKNFFKLKKGFKGNVDEKKLKTKLEKIKNKKYSSSLQNTLNGLRTKKKNLKNNKGVVAVQAAADQKVDFDTLKSLNQKIQDETNTSVKSDLTSDEQGAVDSVEGNILFQSDDLYVPNDITNAIAGQTDWAQSAIISEYPSIYSTVPTLNRKVVVAIIDSGVDYTNDEIKNNMWSSTACVDENNQTITGGCTNGYDFVDNDKDPSATDGFDHGTAVATLIAGSTDNGLGVASLSQNRTKIMALRVADNGYLDLNNIVRAVYFAVNNGADVINMSISGPTYSQSLYDALSYAKDRGVIVVVSAGNQGLDLEMTKVYPASYDLSNIYVVGSLDNDGNISSYSNYGIKTVDILAPGRNVMAGTLGNTFSLHSGTSFSAPIFTGLVARWISESKTVNEEYLGLHSGSAYSNYVIKGKTLALSNTQTSMPSDTTPFNRYYSLSNGKYVDLLSKGAVQLDTIPTQLQITYVDTKGANSLINTFASIVSPGTTNLNNPTVLYNNSVTLIWQRPSDAKIVGVYLTDVTTGVTTYYEPISGTSMNLNLVTGHTYRWNTGATGKSSSSSNPSDYNLTAAVSFQIAGGGSAPGTPVPVSPLASSGNGNSYSGSTINLSWNSVSGATSYNVKTQLTSGGGYGPYSVTGTSYTMSLPGGSVFYWQIQACNNYGCSPFSSANYYNSIATVTNLPPSTPTITGPNSVNVNTLQSYNFTSTDPEGSTLTYDIIWDNVDNPNSVYTTGSSNSGISSAQAKSFSSIKTYCIRARSRDTSGNLSSYSPCYNVTVTGVNKPDLVFSTINAPLTTFTPGYSFTQSINVYNQGNISTSNGFHISVFLNNTNYLIGQATVSQNISPSGSVSVNVPVTLAPSTSPIFSGSNVYYLIFRVDDQFQVDESNETNNDYATNIIINNSQAASKSFGIGNIAQQTAGQPLTVNLNLTGFTQNATAYVYADGNSLDRTVVPITGGATTAQFNLKVLKASNLQNLKVIIDNQTQISNYFKVLTDPNAPIAPQVTNAGSITVSIRNFGNAVVSNANVDICGDNCDATKVSKITDTNGNVTFTLGEIITMPAIKKILAYKGNYPSRRIAFSYNAGAPNYQTIQIPTSDNDTFHNPVILIPGIGGSIMKNDGWILPVLDREKLPDGDKLKLADSTGDWNNGSTIYPVGWEYLKKDLESIGYVRGQTIIDCPYDWRSSNDVTMNKYFTECVNRALASSTKTQVDVIAHSMGGLVTRAYIQTSKANADRIRKIAFVGTPEEGAPAAYKIWVGGDTDFDLARTGMIARAIQANNGVLYNSSTMPYLNLLSLQNVKDSLLINEFKFYATKVAVDKKGTKEFVQNNAFSVRQLIPSEDFLYDKVSGARIPLKPMNENEFLLALNSKTCIDGNCDNGSNSGSSFNYKNFKQTLTDSNIQAQMFYGENVGTTPTSFVIDPATISKYYNEGEMVSRVSGNGDDTVPISSSNGFAIKNSMIAIKTAETHSKLPGTFAKQVTEWISGQAVPNLASLQATGPTSHLNITLGAGVSAYLKAPNGKTLGVNPNGNVSENTIGTDATAVIDASGVTFALDNPTVGNYILYIEGPDKSNYSFYSEFDDSNHKDVAMGTRFHQGSEEVISFNLSGTTDANAKGMIYSKIESVPQNVVVSNNNGNTRISWTASTDAAVTKYRIYSKNPLENNFALLGETVSNIYDTTNIFAGALETYTKDYRVSAVYSDGTETNLTLDYYNNDTDWDGLTDAQETQYNTLLNKIDTDGDGLPDGVEVNITGTDPTKVDTDGNGVDDYNDNKVKYNLKDKVVSQAANNTIFFEDFNRANNSTIGGSFVDGNDQNDNLKVNNNRLNMKWVNQGWGNFHNLYSPIQKQNDIKISYIWNLASAPGIDGYFPFIGVRGGGSNPNDLNGSYGAALYYSGQTDTLSVHILDKGALKAQAAIMSAPLKNTDYNVEIKVTSQNFIEVRIWKVGTTYPASPQASFNNGNSTYTPVANGTNLILTAFHGSTNLYNVDVSIDDLKIENLTVTNATPTINLIGSSTISIYKGSTYTDQGATATDPEDGDLTTKIARTGTVDTSKMGSSTITYTVSDSKFATTSVTRLVNVVADPGPLNLLSYYKFDGTSTSTLKYSDEMRLNGQLQTYISGFASDQDRLSRNDSAIKVVQGTYGGLTGLNPMPVLNQNMTYSAWFKSYNMGSYESILDIPTSNQDEYIRLGVDHGLAQARLSTISGGYMYLSAYTGNVIANGTWHKMDAVYSNSPNAVVKLYLDGQLAASATGTRPYAFASTTPSANMYIECQYSGQSNPPCGNYVFNNGMLDDLRIYGKALADGDVLSEYQKDIAGQQVTQASSTLPTPISNSKFDGLFASASKVKDSIRSVVSVLISANTASDKDHTGFADGSFTTNSTSYIQLDNPKPITTDSQTLSFWVKSTTIMNSSLLSFNSNNGTQNYFSLWISQGKLYPELNWRGGTIGSLVGNYPTKSVADGKWHKVDVVFANKPNATVNVYVDGVIDNSATGVAPYNFLSIDNEIFLGIVRNWQTRIIESYKYPATFDDFKLYDKELSATDISNVYNYEKAMMASLQYGLASSEDEPVELQVINNILNEGDTCTYIFSCLPKDSVPQTQFDATTSTSVQQGEIPNADTSSSNNEDKNSSSSTDTTQVPEVIPEAPANVDNSVMQDANTVVN